MKQGTCIDRNCGIKRERAQREKKKNLYVEGESAKLMFLIELLVYNNKSSNTLGLHKVQRHTFTYIV